MDGIIDFAVIVQLFLLLNPFSSFSFLMAAYRKKMDVTKIAFSSVVTAFMIAVVIALTGPYLFSFFGITINSFRVAGGIVLLLLGIETIRPKENEFSSISGVHSLISIIATPMLTGPATISFIAIKSYELPQVSLLTNLFFAFVLVGFVFVTFAFFVPKINKNLISITSRVFGLFLTAFAIEMIGAGLLAIVRG